MAHLGVEQGQSPSVPPSNPAQSDSLITSTKRKRDPALVSPTGKKNCRVEAPAACNPRSLAKIFLGNGQDLTVCRKDTPDQQDCTTSTNDAAHSSAQNAQSDPPSGARTTPTDSTEDIPSQPSSIPPAVHQLPSSSSSNPASQNSPGTALAESELMAENVPEAVQRLTSASATASSSSTMHEAAASPVLTSPTSLALPAADAYKSLALPRDDDSDSEYGLEFNPYSFVKTLPPLAEVVPKHQKPLLPPQTRRCHRKTLVLDLDETLVHSTLDGTEAADFTFAVKFNAREHSVAVRQRPFLTEFLQRVAQLFEVVIFTASQKVYAEQLLNILDPRRLLIRHRVFRDDCVVVSGNYMKNLTVLGRDLSQTIIVDNSPQAFGFQLSNGIPIESWYDDSADAELKTLLPFLESLLEVPDVRVPIEQKYQLHKQVEKAPKQVFMNF